MLNKFVILKSAGPTFDSEEAARASVNRPNPMQGSRELYICKVVAVGRDSIVAWETETSAHKQTCSEALTGLNQRCVQPSTSGRFGQRWDSCEERRLINLFRSNNSIKNIADQMGRTQSAIWNRLQGLL